MKIAIGSDHAGFNAKSELYDYIVSLGHEVNDLGTYSTESCDYPDYAVKVAKGVAEGKFDYGVLICSTGIGISIAANKVKGIRCGLCTDLFTAEMTRRHNNANILAMGASVTPVEKMKEMLSVFASTGFDGGERHSRRVNKISLIEEGKL